jgi:hypothetical protein
VSPSTDKCSLPPLEEVSSEEPPRDVTGETQWLLDKSKEKLLFGDNPVELGVMEDEIETTVDGLLYLVWL